MGVKQSVNSGNEDWMPIFFQTIPEEKLFIFFQVVIVTIVIPMLVFLLLRATGNVDTIMIAKTSQRKIPLVIHCFLLILLVI